MCPTLCTDFSDSFTSEKFVLMIGRFATIRNCSSLCVVVEHASRNTLPISCHYDEDCHEWKKL